MLPQEMDLLGVFLFSIYLIGLPPLRVGGLASNRNSGKEGRVE